MINKLTRLIKGSLSNNEKEIVIKTNEIIDYLNGTSGNGSYRVYTAILNQSNTDAPVATVLKNTLGGTPTLELYGTGLFKINTNGLLNYSKRTVFISPSSTINGKIFVNHDDEGFSNDFYIFNQLDSSFSSINGLSNISIEIRVYN